MWGSDQAASVEPQGLMRLVRDIRVIERALGDGEKRVYDSEIPIPSEAPSRPVTRWSTAGTLQFAASLENLFDNATHASPT